MKKTQVKVDDFATYGRSAVRFALLVLIAVLLVSVGLGLRGQSLAHAKTLQVLAPIGIVLIVAIAQQRRRQLGSDAQGTVWRALMADEFRQQNLARAVRVAFITVLLVQVPLGVLMETLLSGMGAVFMGYLTILIGVITFLGAFLYYDRDAA